MFFSKVVGLIHECLSMVFVQFFQGSILTFRKIQLYPLFLTEFWFFLGGAKAGVKGAWGDLGPGVEAELSDPQNLFFENDARSGL